MTAINSECLKWALEKEAAEDGLDGIQREAGGLRWGDWMCVLRKECCEMIVTIMCKGYRTGPSELRTGHPWTLNH